MKKSFFAFPLVFLVVFSVPAFADFPISQGAFWEYEAAPRAAYNSQNDEFLVVWNAFNLLYPPSDQNFFGPVRGQRIKPNGALIGTPFDIIYAGVLADVAYNVDRNEYLVAAEQWYNTVGQRLDASGNKIGGQVTLISSARYPRVIYNSLLHNYFVTGVGTVPYTQGGGYCDIYAAQVDAYGSPIGTPTNVTTGSLGYGIGHGIGCEGDSYSIAYAPLEGPDPDAGQNPTPGGRYLLVLSEESTGHMLGYQGSPIPTVIDPYHYGTFYYWIPTPATNQGVPSYNTDVGFGSNEFFLAWSDLGAHQLGCLPGKPPYWGVMWNDVSATRTVYSTDYVNQHEAWPVEWLLNHTPGQTDAMDWKPKVAYNAMAEKFVVAWRETPDPNSAQNDTKVNHIRVFTSGGALCPPSDNIVVSSTTGTEDPKLPCVASSTTSSTVLVGWEDHRFTLGRIFGALLDLPAPPRYSATIWAWDVLGWIAEPITMDGAPTGFSTPHTFTFLTGTHTFTVPNTDIFGYPFRSWDTGETTTTITVNSDGTHTAQYGSALCTVQGGGYTSIQSAYNGAVNGDTIKCQEVLFEEDLAVNRDITVTLAGGYDAGFTSNAGKKTTLKGMITTTKGKITVSNFNLSK